MRQVVDHGPFFGDPDGVMERQDNAAGPDLDTLGDGRERRAGHCRIGVEATK